MFNVQSVPRLLGAELKLQPKLKTRFLLRAVSALSTPLVLDIRNAGVIAPDLDPFILALNHNARPEAVVAPTRLIHARQGKLIHFLADWNFMLAPGVASLYRACDCILVTQKSAKPRFLNRFRGRYVVPGGAQAEAERRLLEGRSIGMFPEGTVNRDPGRLLRGLTGTARLALKTGVPIVPGGIRYPGVRSDGKIGDLSRMQIELGEPIPVSEDSELAGNREAVQQLHAEMMIRISDLSGKAWSPKARRRRYVQQGEHPVAADSVARAS